MNKVILMGRLTRDPEVRYSQGAEGTAVARYSLAVNRSYKREGEQEADFVNIVAFGKRGEFAGKYFKKGMMVAVAGELRISSFTDKDGNKRWSTDVVVTDQYFAGGKRADEGADNQGFVPVENEIEGADNQGFVPVENEIEGADNQGFVPVENEIEGEEDLPF